MGKEASQGKGALRVEATGIGRRRLPAAERRRQIVDAVFEVASEHGIPGTTIARVAQTAGVGIGTVYRYFDDQRAMLQAAAEALSEKLMGTVPENRDGDALDFIRYMAERHYNLVSARSGYFAGLWLEFVSANERLGLRDTILKTQLAAIQAVRTVCERGRTEGSIRVDVDVDLLAYHILQQAWGADMSVLMGLNERFGRNFSQGALDELLASVVAQPREAPRAG